MNIIDLAGRAGFGGQLRNTHKVKLELFAKMVREQVLKEAAENCFGMQTGDVCARMIKEMSKHD